MSAIMDRRSRLRAPRSSNLANLFDDDSDATPAPARAAGHRHSTGMRGFLQNDFDDEIQLSSEMDVEPAASAVPRQVERVQSRKTPVAGGPLKQALAKYEDQRIDKQLRQQVVRLDGLNTGRGDKVDTDGSNVEDASELGATAAAQYDCCLDTDASLAVTMPRSRKVVKAEVFIPSVRTDDGDESCFSPELESASAFVSTKEESDTMLPTLGRHGAAEMFINLPEDSPYNAAEVTFDSTSFGGTFDLKDQLREAKIIMDDQDRKEAEEKRQAAEAESQSTKSPGIKTFTADIAPLRAIIEDNNAAADKVDENKAGIVVSFCGSGSDGKLGSKMRAAPFHSPTQMGSTSESSPWGQSTYAPSSPSCDSAVSSSAPCSPAKSITARSRGSTPAVQQLGSSAILKEITALMSKIVTPPVTPPRSPRSPRSARRGVSSNDSSQASDMTTRLTGQQNTKAAQAEVARMFAPLPISQVGSSEDVHAKKLPSNTKMTDEAIGSPAEDPADHAATFNDASARRQFVPLPIAVRGGMLDEKLATAVAADAASFGYQAAQQDVPRASRKLLTVRKAAIKRTPSKTGNSLEDAQELFAQMLTPNASPRGTPRASPRGGSAAVEAKELFAQVLSPTGTPTGTPLANVRRWTKTGSGGSVGSVGSMPSNSASPSKGGDAKLQKAQKLLEVMLTPPGTPRDAPESHQKQNRPPPSPEGRDPLAPPLRPLNGSRAWEHAQPPPKRALDCSPASMVRHK